MHDFFKVFFINLVSDIDNMLILGTILRKYSYLKLTLAAAIVLTFTRTIYGLAENTRDFNREMNPPSYFVATVSEHTEKQIRQYIQNQKKN